MTFLKSIVILLILAVAFSTAEPPRFRSRISRLQQQQQQQRRRPFFARQESAPSPSQPDSAALYPSADELKPENPFEGEEEIADPDVVYGPPDSIYGPPLPETDVLPAVEAPPQFAPNPDVEEFSSLFLQRPSRLQQRPQQQRAQLHLVQRPQRLQQRRRPQQQQRTTIKQIVDVPRQKATIRQVVSAQRLVARPSAAGALVVAAPAVSPTKVVVNSERLVAAEPAPIFSASVDIPAGESYFVVNAPFAYSPQYQEF